MMVIAVNNKIKSLAMTVMISNYCYYCSCYCYHHAINIIDNPTGVIIIIVNGIIVAEAIIIICDKSVALLLLLLLPLLCNYIIITFEIMVQYICSNSIHNVIIKSLLSINIFVTE